MGIQAAILDAGKLAEAISKVMQLLSALNPDRAVILEVQNQTSQTLRLVSHDHTDGGFAELPSTEIPAGTADVFGSRDTSLTSGTKGKVTYESSDGYLLTIDWDNPVSGPNRCHAQVLGSNAGNFETQAITGAGNTAHMQFTVRPGMMSRRPVRKGSLTAGAVSTDIALVNNGPRGVITAIRAGDETLKLGSWEVSDDGMTIRQLAEAQAGKASDIDIAIGRLIVTACRAANGNLFLISWEDRGGTIDRRNDSRDAAGHDRAGSASVINILALTEQIFVTAVRNGSGNLMLLTWSLESNGELTRIADSGSQADTVSEIALVRVDADLFGNHRVVTAVRAGDGTLLPISWKVSPDGRSIERLSHDHGQAGRADLIRAVTINGNIIVTSMRAADGNLLLISWAIDSDGSITRRADSHGLAGEIFSNAIMRNPVGVLSAVESGHGLMLIKWKITPQGAISRGADSDMQAGESSLVTLAQERLAAAAQTCSVIKNGGGDLMLITWADE